MESGYKEDTVFRDVHLHVMSPKDAFIPPKPLARKLKEQGKPGCAITDHGVLTAIEDFRRIFKEEGLKLVPGCEIYVDSEQYGRNHLVLLAMDDFGYAGVSKICTEGQKNIGQGGTPLVDEGFLMKAAEKYRGHIVATSACIAGIIAACYCQNDRAEHKAEALRKKLGGLTNPAGPEIRKAEEEEKAAGEALETLIMERDEAKRLSEMKFAAREKSIAAKEKAGADVSEMRLALENDRKASAEAKSRLPEIKEAMEKAKRARSTAKKELKELNESAQKYAEAERELRKIEESFKSESELESDADERARKYEDAFGKGNFYIEIQNHWIKKELSLYPKIYGTAKRTGIPIVVTNDVHILDNTPDDRLRRQIMRSTRDGGKAFLPEMEGDGELYLKDEAGMRKALKGILPDEAIEEGIRNSKAIFDRSDVKFDYGKHYPKFHCEDADKKLEEEVRKGIAWRFPDGFDKEHEERLKKELLVIESMHYSDYHLVVKDFLEYGRLLGYVPEERLSEAPLDKEELKQFIKENGWKNPGYRIGTARGSAAGSLVCYLLGITNMDPLKYGLLFERFLNPERVSMPDIDSDISNASRSKVIEYVQHVYGKDAVCGIGTVLYQAPKKAVLTAAKFYGLKEKGEAMTALGQTISKDIPEVPNASFNMKVGNDGKPDDKGAQTLIEYMMRKNYAGNKEALAIIDWARVMEGTFDAYGAHAAGIIISDNDDVSDYVPLKASKLGIMVTQCDMVEAEEDGLLKFDFLGLKTLDVITEAMQYIEQEHGIVIDPLKVDLEDENTYRLLAEGRTASVFQFESQGMRNMLKRFRPDKFEDLVLLVAAYRPGPMQYLDDIIEVKNGRKAPEYATPELEPILKDTYGAMIYQEQVMRACQDLAGFTLGHADIVRRYMSKKKAEKLAHERPAFIEGCREQHGIPEEVSSRIFDEMMAFAKYAFNKSHAAAYAYNSYLTAWLKANYPAEFFAAALNWANSKKLPGLMYDAAQCGVKVEAPDVNRSGMKFVPRNGKVYFGLSMVKGVASAAESIIKERRENGPYKSVSGFLMRSPVNQGAFNALADAGAFDSLHGNRAAVKAYAEEASEIISKMRAKDSFIRSAEAVLPIVENSDADTIVKAQEGKGLKAEIKAPCTASSLEKKMANARKALSENESLLRMLSFQDMPEDLAERLGKEREILGAYVTAHPMDAYPASGDVGCVPVSDITEDAAAAYGIVTGLSIRKRRSDGAEMAFFTLEDRSGSMPVACFARAYKKAGRLLKEGAVLKLYGRVQEDDFGKDDGEDEGGSLKFYMESATEVGKAKSAFIMRVTSLASFHVLMEESFRSEHEDAAGHPLVIWDDSMKEMRLMKYKVDDGAVRLPNVEDVI